MTCGIQERMKNRGGEANSNWRERIFRPRQLRREILRSREEDLDLDSSGVRFLCGSRRIKRRIKRCRIAVSVLVCPSGCTTEERKKEFGALMAAEKTKAKSS